MSNELIRKTDVLDLLNDFYSDFEEYSHLFDDIDFMKPANAVEQKTGRWVNTDTTVWDAKDMDGEQELEISIVAAKCSVCERWAEQVNKFPLSPSMTYNFCPYCGAKMEGEVK